MNVPSFLKLEENSLLFNLEDSEFVFCIPENFFDEDSKSAIAILDGEYVTCIGIINYFIINKNGKKSKSKLFNFPTMFMCKPYEIEKVKNYKIEENIDPDDYRLLKFRKGDEVISQVRVPKMIDNVELFFAATVLSAKFPTTIAYDKGWELFERSMQLNGGSFGLSAQMFGLLWRILCRDPKDVSREFRLTNITDMHAYKPMSIKLAPNFISPYTAMVSEYFDESIRSAILMKDEKDYPYSPLEKVVMQ